MESLIIQGGKPLNGEIKISGSKNAALPIICASLLSEDPVILKNVPNLKDVNVLLNLIKSMGVKVKRCENEIKIQAQKIVNFKASYNLVRAMRASILLLGPLLARFGKAKLSLPGGCPIGERPIDQHIKGLTALGANIRVSEGFVLGTSNRLKGISIRNEMITVTGTENLLMAAVLAEGCTVLENAATEPEIIDLAELLIAMGAKIFGHGTNRIIIEGVSRLHGATYEIIPDRIEAGTFLCAVAANTGHIILKNVNPLHMTSTLEKLEQTGVSINTGKDWIDAKMKNRPKPVDISTRVYPGFATDMQAQFMALNTIADGTAIIVENIFENRFMHVQELKKLGANIHIDGHTAVVHGVESLFGEKVNATDLRASASLIIAALQAKGSTIINQIYHLDRGYEKVESKFRSLGANIERIGRKLYEKKQ